MKSDSRQIHWPSALQFALSTIAATSLLGLGFSMALAGLALRFDTTMMGVTSTPFFLMAAGMLIIGLLLLPSAAFALLRLAGRPGWLENYRPDLPLLRPTLVILLLPLLLYLGYRISQLPDWEWLLLPPVHVLAIGLPILWLVYVGRRGISTGSGQQTWGVLGSGLVIGPLLIMLAEIAALAFFLLLGILYLVNRPELLDELSNLAQRLAQAPPNPEIYQRILEPWLAQPGVLYAAFVFIAIIVPLIEEALKPIGVWLLAGRDLSPNTGFALGLLSGAGYALFESLAFTSNANDWALIAGARIGTGVIHIVTAGLTGWALATAWRRGSYLRLGVAYLTAVLLHALWNGLTLLATGSQLAGTGLAGEDFISNLADVAPLGLGVLTLVGFILLLGANHRLRQQAELTQL